MDATSARFSRVLEWSVKHDASLTWAVRGHIKTIPIAIFKFNRQAAWRGGICRGVSTAAMRICRPLFAERPLGSLLCAIGIGQQKTNPVWRSFQQS